MYAAYFGVPVCRPCISSFALFHFGLSFFLFTKKKRPILVFQYEDPASPPPGVGLVGSQVIALMGWVLNNEKV